MAFCVCLLRITYFIQKFALVHNNEHITKQTFLTNLIQINYLWCCLTIQISLWCLVCVELLLLCVVTKNHPFIIVLFTKLLSSHANCPLLAELQQEFMSKDQKLKNITKEKEVIFLIWILQLSAIKILAVFKKPL